MAARHQGSMAAWQHGGMVAWQHGGMCPHTNHLLWLSPHLYRHHYSPAVKKSHVTNANYQCSDSSAKGIWWGKKQTSFQSHFVLDKVLLGRQSINSYLRHRCTMCIKAVQLSPQCAVPCINVSDVTNIHKFFQMFIHNLCQTNICHDAAIMG